MQTLIDYFQRQAAEVMFAVALILLIYTIARILKARSGIALGLAFAPLFLAWVYSFGVVRNIIG